MPQDRCELYLSTRAASPTYESVLLPRLCAQCILSDSLSIYPSIYLSTYLSIYLAIYLSIIYLLLLKSNQAGFAQLEAP